ncbi:hypothetical protein K435DRAFT_757653 [Dendrothele bispora CBS 962.96]|uniref:BRCT domain-containing protein n=1 Tax=Dendrothele bispora (strain CBS 962.96) TaxID=1314807 RepID=A0A4S8LUP8_DENBC|nr:hypothetical protein K435DRAFT_757653 [Dendrothele bispora CBS 962.96]
MRRRGHKSTKIPNVKLRPVQQGTSSRAVARESTVEGIYAQDTQPASDDTSIFDPCPRPFKGIRLCATGLLDKPGIFKQAVELGALTSNPFTDRVTHLVAVEHGGAKYMCALNRKVPILDPSFVSESYQVWLRGDDVDLEQAVAKHRLPIFSGVVVCPSGITDIKRRTQINDLVTKHGGMYLKNLERPVRVTHLLCSGDDETDKIRYAEKFNNTGEANIKIVWEEWFWDSLEFGGRFNEKKYAVHEPRPEPRINATQPLPPLPSGEIAASTPDIEVAGNKSKEQEKDAGKDNGGQRKASEQEKGKEGRDKVEEKRKDKPVKEATEKDKVAEKAKEKNKAAGNDKVEEKGKEKQVDRTTGKDQAKERKGTQEAEQDQDGSETEEEDDELTDTASVKRLPTVHLKLWASLLKNRGYDVDEENSRLVRSPTKSQSRSQSMDDSSMPFGRPNNTGSILSNSDFRRANSFGPILPRGAPTAKRILSSKARYIPSASEEDNPQGLEEREMSVDGFDANVLGNVLVMDTANPVEIDTPGAGPSSPRKDRDPSKLTSVAPDDIQNNAEPDLSKKNVTSVSPIFAGLRFLALGEANCRAVKDAVEQAEGIFLERSNEDNLNQYPDDVDVVLIRLSASELFCKHRSAPLSWREKFRTECWLERCLFEDRICPPQQNVSFTPISVSCPIKGCERVFMSCSGFDESERLFMRRLLKVFGITLLSVFSKRATYLLCPSADGLKYEKAKEWGIPVVSMEWIREIKRTGVIPKTGSFLVAGQTVSTVQGRDLKGKRKASDGESRMADITNGQSPLEESPPTQPPTQDAGQHQSIAPPASPQRLRGHLSSVPSLSKLTLSEKSAQGSSESFGKPNFLLQIGSASKSPSEETSAVAALVPVEPVQNEACEDFETGFGQPPEAFSISDEPIPLETRPSTPSRPRLLTAIADWQDTNDPQGLMRVPSSTTPSPMKEVVPASLDITTKGDGRTVTKKKSQSLSPTKFYPPPRPIDEEKTKALHESLSSLLGKRRSEDGIEGNESNTNGTGRVTSGIGRGKRPRPLRTKSSTAVQAAPIKSLHDLDSFPPEHDYMSTELSVSMMEDELREQTLRITYHEPTSQEKSRSSALLDTSIVGVSGSSRTKDRTKGATKTDGVRRNNTRKSGSRQAGF